MRKIRIKLKGKSKTFFNVYSLYNFLKNSLIILATLLGIIKGFFIKSALCLLLIIIVELIIIVFIIKKYYIAKPISKNDIKQKYLYHCLSKEKLESISNNNYIYLKRTSKKIYNLSSLFRPVVYFHSNLRGNSLVYNHGYRIKDMDYILIIDKKYLSDNLYMRKIDDAILDRNEFIGKCKCISINKFNVYKKIKNKYIKHIFIDSVTLFLIIDLLVMYTMFLIFKF
ncbi:hypothetical protein [Clostridium sporogenes]|uniref:hypothetical protein n=1 Tax=Clostridium sporogenes TaxID=1509 RepID=UPI0006B27737|nr:hypothetical protein [Clostridium sporogenes]KOY66136.1 hypothetical protein AN649_10005 [Clostridium sporogenes]MDS1006435.1 hypothetical protein [Clostridium sporogenes]